MHSVVQKDCFIFSNFFGSVASLFLYTEFDSGPHSKNIITILRTAFSGEQKETYTELQSFKDKLII